MATAERTSIEELAEGFAGQILSPGVADYEEARRLHNGLVDKRPAVIARCTGTPDVQTALRYARRAGLEVAVRGGGHSIAGHSTLDDGVLIDLSGLRGIHVDARARTARAQPGVRWSELNRETSAFGLAVTGGIISTTGIAGLTLGGGFGWLMGKHGLAADNLLSADVVTVDGDVLRAAETENADLFWALRGGGGNFGIVTSFEYRLHPVADVLGGLVAHPIDAARDVLRLFRDISADAPDDLGMVAALLHAPGEPETPIAAVALCHAGDAATARDDVSPLLDFGSPLLENVERMPYPRMNTLLDGGYPRGALNYWKSSFLTTLDDEVVGLLAEAIREAPSKLTQIAIESFHGAVTRVPADATAVPHREPGFNLLLTSVWTDHGETEANIAWTRDLYKRLGPTLAERRYTNYLDSDDDAARAAYGPNYERLVEIKRRYDPDNVLRLNTNLGGGGGAGEAGGG